MTWWTGGSVAILVCAVVVGCADDPDRPTAQPVDRLGESAGRSEGGTPSGTAAEPEREPGTPSDPRAPGTRVPPRTADDLPGVPGSPIKYDNTLFGASPEVARDSIEREIGGKCGPGLCGVRVVTAQRGGEGCISEISPMPVDPGGTVTVYHGPNCAEQRGEVPAGESSTGEPGPTPESTPEPTTAPTSEPTTEGPAGTTGAGP